MLHSLSAMSRLILIPSLILLFCALVLSPAFAQDEPAYSIEILSPLSGEAVQGLAQIVGTVDIEGFESYTLEFAFQSSSAQNWFPIAQGTTPIINGVLGEWDTSLLVDDIYDLRLTVHTQNADPIIGTVYGLRVRNYSAIETSTPTPTLDQAAFTPTADSPSTPTATATPNTTPTPLPQNQAAVNFDHVKNAAQIGLLIGFIFVVFVIFYQSRLNKRN